MPSDEETKAAEAKAAEDKAKAQAAKSKLNVPAPSNRNKKGEANSPQASGTNNQGAAVTFTTPATLPPAPGRKPTIKKGKLDLLKNDLKTKIFVILHEAKGGNQKSKQELRKIMMNTIHGELFGMLIAMKKSGKVAVGHSMFEYLSQCLREEDEYHGSSLVYMGDRDEEGQDPTAYEMDEKTIEDMGGVKTVVGVEDQELIRTFYSDEANKGKLFVPPDDAVMKERLVAAVLPASKRNQQRLPSQ